ncbi:MAG: glycosyltransferase family 4 protein [Chitinophagaceae bacterium]|nr:glycosyltransferase family 4 protein [Chitinophagaceae bacterium]
MKVLHILAEIKYSGAEIMLSTAESLFKKAGVETHALAMGKNEGEYAPVLRQKGFHVAHIPFRKNFSFFTQLRRYIRANKFDIIHIHNEQAFLWVALTCWTPFKKNIIRTVHSNFSFSGYLYLRRLIHHWVAQHILKVKFLSIAKSVYENELKVYKTKTVLINNWIDTGRFTAANTDCLNKQSVSNTIISVGSCIPLKNHTAILKLIKILKDRGHIFHYLHLGTGELEQCETETAKKLGINEQVTFCGNRNDVETYLAKASYFMMPSDYEGLSISCVEAMSSGRVVFVNDTYGLKALVTHNKTGFVVNFSNLDAVADTFISVHKNQSLKSKVSENAKKYVAAKYGLKNVSKLIEFYDQAVS